jgi:hypothetical protein
MAVSRKKAKLTKAVKAVGGKKEIMRKAKPHKKVEPEYLSRDIAPDGLFEATENLLQIEFPEDSKETIKSFVNTIEKFPKDETKLYSAFRTWKQTRSVS